MMGRKDLYNLESLYMLSAIAEYQGKRQAAEMLGISVDTISKYISNMELELGVKLLVSNSRGSYLTPNGHKLLEEFRKLKGVLSNVYTLKPEEETVQGSVRVLMNAGASSRFLCSEISDFLDSYPLLNLQVTNTFDRPTLANMAYDVAISYYRPTGSDEVIMGQKKVLCGYFASPEFLGRYGYPHDIDDMTENYRMINFENNMSSLAGWRELMKKAKIVPYSTNSTLAVDEAVSLGAGIGILPLRFKDSGLVCLDNIPCSECLMFYLIAHRKTKDVPRVRAVINYYHKFMELL